MNRKIKAALKELPPPIITWPDKMSEEDFLIFMRDKLKARGAKARFANEVPCSRGCISDLLNGKEKLAPKYTLPFGYTYKLVPVIERLKR